MESQIQDTEPPKSHNRGWSFASGFLKGTVFWAASAALIAAGYRLFGNGNRSFINSLKDSFGLAFKSAEGVFWGLSVATIFGSQSVAHDRHQELLDEEITKLREGLKENTEATHALISAKLEAIGPQHPHHVEHAPRPHTEHTKEEAKFAQEQGKKHHPTHAQKLAAPTESYKERLEKNTETAQELTV